MSDQRAEIDQLAQLLTTKRGAARPVELRQGVVWGLGPGSLSVLLGGQQELVDSNAFPVGGVRFLRSYNPKLGETVHILDNGGDLIIIGSVNPAYDPDPELFYIGIDDAPIFTNSWANLGGVYAPAHFWLDSDGFVHLAGNVTGGTTGNAMFTLPPGYRPKALRRFIVSRRQPPTGSNIWALMINDSGQVFLENKTPPANLNSGISLSGVCFMAEDLLPDHARSYEWTPIIYAPTWAWHGAHDGYDFPATWQRWDGLVRLRGHVQGFGEKQIMYLPERACKRRFNTLFMSMDDSGTALTKHRVDFTPNGRVLSDVTSPGASDLTLDSIYWWADHPETTWNLLPLLNGWVAYSIDGTWGAPTYFMDGYGMVHIRGLMRSGTTTSGTAVAELPEGFRPYAREVFPGAHGGDGFNPDLTRLEVDPDGFIYLVGNIAASNFVSLDHIVFRANLGI